jgi:hypothetical protein
MMMLMRQTLRHVSRSVPITGTAQFAQGTPVRTWLFGDRARRAPASVRHRSAKLAARLTYESTVHPRVTDTPARDI